MDLKDFVVLLRRNRLLVMISTIAATLLAFGVTYLMTPMYEAKVQLFVSTQSSDLDVSALVQGSSFSQQRVKSYSQIIVSPTTLKPVADKLRLEFDSTELSKRVRASAPLDTVLINVTVSDESPIRAALIANEIGSYFSTFVNELELTRVDKSPPIKVSVVQAALPPDNPSSPRMLLNLVLGLILGFGIGIGIALLRKIFDNTIKGEADLSGTPLLGAVGFDPEAQSKPLITQIGKYAARTEAFRLLRTNLQYIKADSPPKVIAVSSAVPGEGKTSTILNLALSLATSGFKVLLIEADLRRPKISKYSGIAESKIGLSEILSGKIEGEVLKRAKSATQILGQDVQINIISSGAIPPNPAELLGSETFSELIAKLREEYDFVLIDAPPVLPVADASVIATRCDGVVIIVSAGSTKKVQLQGVLDSLANVGATVFGIVINKIPFTRHGHEYGYRYGYGYGYKGRYGGYRNTGYKSYTPYAGEERTSQ